MSDNEIINENNITFSPLSFPGSFRSEGIKASDVLPVLREKIAFVSGECEICEIFWVWVTKKNHLIFFLLLFAHILKMTDVWH